VIDKRLTQFPISYTTVIGKVAVGWGVHQTVGDECKMAGIKKALIVTTGLKGTGIIEEIRGILNYHGIASEIFSKVTSNPKDYEVMEGYQVFKNSGCDGVISVGGGSSHDCGKGIRAVASNDGKYVCDMAVFINPPWMETIKNHKPVTIPQITVNTTAGTGAELTPGGPIINSRTRTKQLIIVPGLAMAASLVDPILVRLMPQNIAAQTGFDALAHAFEGHLSRMVNPYSSALMFQVMKLVGENLREFAYNRMNHRACENMCWAESMAGLGMIIGGGSGIVHGLAHGISVLRGVHHGLANASVTLPLERYNEPVFPEKFAEMARAMGVDTRNMTTMQAADKWFEEIERLLRDLGIQTGDLNKRFGLQKDDIKHIVKYQYDNDFAIEGNPHEFNFDDCVTLMESML
jgi:methanol:N,N-dimethyl-4-nitrosoaniline oxidoreductase